MKSLVTGGAGFIGSNLIDTLLGIGHTVVCVDNESSDAHDKPYWNNDSINIRGDIRDYNLMSSAMKGVDFVFHLAAEARIQPSIENPINAVSINDLGTATVLQCARENQVKKVMFSSTSAAYGRNDSPNVETQYPDPLNPYSVTKLNGENLCKMYTQLFGLRTVIFRYFNVYGPRQPVRGQYAPVLGIFKRQKDAGEELTIVGDGNQRRDFVHVEDVARANVMAALGDPSGEVYGEVYNVGTGQNFSVNEIAEMFQHPKTYIAPRPGEARVSLANNQKIRNTFGWSPTHDLEKWVDSQK
jgi:UDP-glucose 4-epimerase|tara:strand:- start:1398 stop:2294 length:897 start_codon:yes stop_codon:yes gene_type:complete